MSNRILQLDRVLYEQIAAGEVVTAPVSVVKELCENSIDAGATEVTIEIRGGGKELIRISDNGIGISADDVSLAFAPHSTSKIAAAADLDSIETLGFRGEALSSIAAVSKVKMITKTSFADVGTLVLIEGGEVPKIEGVGADTGTVISVTELFYNVPARQKFLKSNAAETTKIVDFVSRLAIAYPSIKIKLISDGAALFSTLGNGSLLNTITSVYGSGVTNTLLEVNAESAHGKMTLSGYISNATGSRKTRRNQVLFVNGRAVSNKLLTSAIDSAYKEFAEGGKFPVVYLFLTLPPRELDVNIHPSKLEVAFADNGAVRDFVERSLFGALSSEKGIPRLVKNAFLLKDDGGVDHPVSFAATPPKEGNVPEVKISDLFKRDSGAGAGMTKVDDTVVDHNKLQLGRIVDNLEANIIDYSLYHNILQSNEDIDSAADNIFIRENTDAKYNETLDIAGLSVIATLFATYILASNGDSFYIIDQHAAHERINYEKFLRSYNDREVLTQELLNLHTFTVPAVAIPHIDSYISFLKRLGYDIEEFGENTYATSTFPSFMSFDEAEVFLTDILSLRPEDLNAAMNSDVKGPNSDVDRIIMRACKSSIKANRKLSDVEIAALLGELGACDNPYTCPHGRPVFLKLTKAEIERMFKRS
ncbi:MAG: DNA mismatch repair endonuclease MutL [Clostridiales Family XIII bacterium]|jgi:DNA mismatch repair protein MutL|nr:DNA mismatch repair endonuclease MutL [Clostridiales Family XIII bacterium]